VAASQYILGLQPVVDGLKIDPCIPSEWNEFEMTRIFRGKKLRIKVENPDSVQKGVIKVFLNGAEINGSIIDSKLLKEANDVIVTMG
jgi:N,N'-diacetylchitobiose phosphorylase